MPTIGGITHPVDAIIELLARGVDWDVIYSAWANEEERIQFQSYVTEYAKAVNKEASLPVPSI